ncbi:hypothetical protein [Methylobacter svalbardensis]|uniref:hypothetical protein n=1 Tax=Methylobacter svalbardensis TaxID=3080016 RepID=UPI0030ECC8E3
MFRNIFKKTTPKQTSGNDISNFPLAHDKKASAAKKINIPVSFLKRLMPVAQLLTENEIQKLRITASSYTPGSIILAMSSLTMEFFISFS